MAKFTLHLVDETIVSTARLHTLTRLTTAAHLREDRHAQVRCFKPVAAKN